MGKHAIVMTNERDGETEVREFNSRDEAIETMIQEAIDSEVVNPEDTDEVDEFRERVIQDAEYTDGDLHFAVKPIH